MDSVPIVAITGQVPTPVVGNDAFQEADIAGITMPVTKHNFLVTDPGEVAETVREAFHIARDRPARPGAGRPARRTSWSTRPTWNWPEQVDLPGYKPTTKGNLARSSEAAKLILEAKRPVLYVGGGVIKADATEELFELATDGHPAGRHHADGARRVPGRARAVPGMPGMHGNYTAVTAMQKADLLVALGARFDDRVTGKLDGVRAATPKIIHVDIDPAEIGKNRRPTCRSWATAKDVIGEARTPSSRERQDEAGGVPDRRAVARAARRRGRTEFPLPLRPAARRTAQAAVRDRAAARPHATATRSSWPASASTRCGPSQFWHFEQPAARGSTPGGLGHDGLRGAGGASAPRPASPTSAWSRSTATAASR